MKIDLFYPTYAQQEELRLWCVENIKGYWAISRASTVHGGHIYIEDADDYVHFKLRWSDEVRGI